MPSETCKLLRPAELRAARSSDKCGEPQPIRRMKMSQSKTNQNECTCKSTYLILNRHMFLLKNLSPLGWLRIGFYLQTSNKEQAPRIDSTQSPLPPRR